MTQDGERSTASMEGTVLTAHWGLGVVSAFTVSVWNGWKGGRVLSKGKTKPSLGFKRIVPATIWRGTVMRGKVAELLFRRLKHNPRHRWWWWLGLGDSHHLCYGKKGKVSRFSLWFEGKANRMCPWNTCAKRRFQVDPKQVGKPELPCTGGWYTTHLNKWVRRSRFETHTYHQR